MSSFRRGLSSFQSTALAYAQDYLGEGEVGGNNRGPMVAFFLRCTGFDEGAAWCAAFVNGCAEQAQAVRNVYSPLEQVPHQALVQSYADWAEREDRIVTDTARVATGDLVCFDMGRTGRKYDHMGFVSAETDVPAGHFPTIEANTSPGVSVGAARDRDGEIVTRKVRSYEELDPLFIHWEPRG